MNPSLLRLDLTSTLRRWSPGLVLLLLLGACAEGEEPGTVEPPALRAVQQAMGPGITLNDGGGVAVSESGADDTYTVTLAEDPGMGPDITVTLDGGAQLRVADNAAGVDGTQTLDLTFNTDNWNTGFTIVVTAVDDDVAEGSPHAASITHTSASSRMPWSGLTASQSVDITDNDTAGVTLNAGGGVSVTEGGATDIYTVVLTSEPTADVTVTLATHPQLTTNVPGSTLTFTPANWDTPQTVTVTAVNDDIDEDTQVIALSHDISSADATYNALPDASLNITVNDDDTAGVTVAHTGGNTSVTEGGATDTYTVVLTSEPTADVTVSVAANGEVSTAPTSRTFTPANWSTPQSVTVTATDDPDVEGAHMTTLMHTVTSADAKYSGASVNGLSISITDNDTASVAVVQSGGNTAVTEGGATDSFTVALTARPANNTTINLSAAGGQINVSPTSLTFTPANWSTTQTVTVTAVDDLFAEGAHNASVTFATSSSDAAFNNLTVPAVNVAITDNDSAGVTLIQSGGNTAVTEGGASDTVTVRLTSRPLQAVTVAFAPQGPTAQVTATPGSVVFDTSATDWMTEKTVTIAAVDDSDVEGAHNTTVVTTVTSADPLYNNFNLADVNVAITDNDSVGIILSNTSGQVTEATGAGRTHTVSVRLNSRPSQDVTLSFVSNDTSEGTVSPASMTFSKNNMANRWDINQTLTITGVNDDLDDDNVSYQVAVTSSSADSNYQNLTRSISMTTLDDDTAGITITPTSGLTVTEAGGASRTTTFTIRLNSQPTQNVNIPLSSSDTSEGTVSPATAQLTAANWSAGVTVTITGVDDMVNDGNVGFTIMTGNATSSDPKYSGMSAPNVSVSNTDNDRPTLRIGAPTPVIEGDSGTPQLMFPVTLSVPSVDPVSVRYRTAQNSGQASQGVDFTQVTTAQNRRLEFSAGVTELFVPINILPDNLDESDETLRVILDDPMGGRGPLTATIAGNNGDRADGTIRDDDDTPTATARSLSTMEDTNLSNSVMGADGDDPASSLTFARATNASHGSVTLNANGSFTYVPNADYNGPDSFTFTVSDGTNTSAPGTVSITVTAVNDAPRNVSAGGPYTVNEGAQVQLSGAGTDVEGSTLSYAWDFDDDGSFDDATGRTPMFRGDDGPATVTVRVRVSDGQLNTQATANVTVNNVAPDATALNANPSANILEGDPVVFTAVATDPGDPVLAYAWTFGDGGTAAGDNLSQTTHTFIDEGSYTVRAAVDDGDGGADSVMRSISVANAPPAFIATAPAFGAEGQPYRFDAAATDPGVCDELTWSFITAPTGMTLTEAACDSNTSVACPGDGSRLRCRRIEWTPSNAQALEGTHDVRLRLVDDSGAAVVYSWTVDLNFSDSDGGGAPDTCEIAYNFDPELASDDVEDADGDGIPNFVECLQGLNPRSNDAPAAPNINSPARFAVVGGDVPLSVLPPDGAPAGVSLRYDFEAMALGAAEVIYSDEDLPGAANQIVSTVPGALLEEDGRYLWRARASYIITNAAQTYEVVGPWTETETPQAPDATRGSFTYSNVDDPPPAPVPLAPLNVTSSRTPSFSASNVEDPEGSLVLYDFELVRVEPVCEPDATPPCTFGATALPQGAAMTVWSPGIALEENALYRWRVRASDVRGSGPGSGPWSASVDLRVDSENSLPPEPRILYPAPGQLITDVNEAFIVAAGFATDDDAELITYTLQVALQEDLSDAISLTGLLPGDPEAAQQGGRGEFGAALADFVGFSPLEDALIYVAAFGNDGAVDGPVARSTFRLSRANGAPQAPLLMAPSDGQPVASVAPTLGWMNPADPEQQPVRFDVQLYTDAGLATLAWEVRGVAASGASTSTLTTAPLQAPLRYWWRVRAVDSEGAEGPWSEVWSFFTTLNNLPPSAPQRIAPEDGQRFTLEDALTLQWSPGVDPEGERLSYAVEVLDGAGTVVFAEADQEETSVTLPALEPGGYVWTTRAFDGVAYSLPSLPGRFIVEVTPPEQPDPTDRPEPEPAGAPRYPEPLGESCACATPAAAPSGLPAPLAALGALLLGALLLRRR